MNTGLMTRVTLCLLMSMMVSTAACSNKAVYDNMQLQQRNECREQPMSSYVECLDRAEKTYRDYQRERKEAQDQ